MDTRRDFLKKAMLFSGAAACQGAVPESIRKATAINPAPGSTYLDAEHVVILMQENRSFDHCFGSLKGVRGFNDPRAIQLPNGNPVWLQSNDAGETFAPFRFDIRDTKITWMGSVPHSRHSQVDAHNLGKHDQWLEAKRPGNKAYAHLPLTLGYYTRADLPFNYALADAFTVCDQNFSSAMTSTWPNRLFLWSGTIRGEQNGDAKAFIRNDIPYGEAHWTSFPEILEKHEVSWKIYQNEITAGGGYVGDERAWLSNFGCNLLENLSQFHVRFSPRYIRILRQQIVDIPAEIAALQTRLAALPPESADDIEDLKTQIAMKEEALARARTELVTWNEENYDRLPPESKSLHQKAFGSNAGDPDYLQLASLSYEENGDKRELHVPKGDILHQFRQDVSQGKLPAVSWMVGPENFSDHPTAPWYGSWYVSEILDILTQNPEVWQKTIFILTYDENDGYFDHVPPFVAPDPLDPATGKCSPGIDTSVEYIRREKELAQGVTPKEAREGPVGLGYRVPMVIASPWSRGGRVCSQVFDHTSAFRFVQEFLSRKTGRPIQESNTSLWRKTVSGNLTSAFRPYDGEGEKKLPWLERTPFMESIYSARFKDIPANIKPLTPEDLAQIGSDPASSLLMAHQEPGVKPSCGLPYQLYAESQLTDDRKNVIVRMAAGNEVFGDRSAGSPFNVYLPGKYAVPQEEGMPPAFESVGNRSYAVIAGTDLEDSWPIASFEHGLYHLRVYGPNGFYREFRGSESDPALQVQCDYERSAADPRQLTGKLQLTLENQHPNQSSEVEIRDHAYHGAPITRVLPATGSAPAVKLVMDQTQSRGWYDFSITVKGFEQYARHYAGRIETGEESITDPQMGRV